MLRKHSVSIQGHQTSFSLEDEFWEVFRQIAEERKAPIAKLIREIDTTRPEDRNLSSAIRVFVLQHVQNSAAQPSTETSS